MAGSSTLSRRLSEILGVVLFGAALIWGVALVTYEPSDPAWFFNTTPNTPPANFIGPVGAFLAELSYQLLGYASLLVPLSLMALSFHLFWCCRIDAIYTKGVGLALLFSCVAALFSLAVGRVEMSGRVIDLGGYAGSRLAEALISSLNRPGAIILLGIGLILSLILVTQFSFGRLFSAVFAAIGSGLVRAARGYRAWRDERRREKQRREVIAKHTRRRGQAPAEQPASTDGAASGTETRPSTRPATRPQGVEEAAAQAEPVRPATRPPAVSPRPSTPPKPEPQPVLTFDAPVRGVGERRKGTCPLPPLALLDAPRVEQKIDERELLDSARLLEDKCREFAVAGSVVQIHPGPVVTTFEFKPDAGVKYSKITSLADDLSLALRAESVLIERLPGKSTVGIQIPNANREQISLRELLESEAYRRSESKLTLALGKTIHGEPFVTDLATMPHLLIAGSTGAGKSVAINAMLASILFRASPDDVRLILIDPKRLELGVYEHIPHLLTPVVVDPKQAANALAWAVREMEERYRTLAAEGVRNLEQYNRNVREAAGNRDTPPGGEVPKPLPCIVVVIDELADLMMVASTDVEESIARLAQMARAVGIHLILATQRPSVDVITGLIKANLPARLSFRVSSKVDSRTILDGNGAEQLLGKGDMLFLPPASSRLIRLHGPYISEQESARLASFLRKQGKPHYDETIVAEEKSTDAVVLDRDDLYDEAARLVVATGQASISYLQRRLRIGFARAARLIDMMEAEGIVSAAMGGKPREVLVDKGYFDEVDLQLR